MGRKNIETPLACPGNEAQIKTTLEKAKAYFTIGLATVLGWSGFHGRILAAEQSDFRGKAERLRSQRKYISRCAWELTEILPVCADSEALFQGS